MSSTIIRKIYQKLSEFTFSRIIFWGFTFSMTSLNFVNDRKYIVKIIFYCQYYTNVQLFCNFFSQRQALVQNFFGIDVRSESSVWHNFRLTENGWKRSVWHVFRQIPFSRTLSAAQDIIKCIFFLTFCELLKASSRSYTRSCNGWWCWPFLSRWFSSWNRENPFRDARNRYRFISRCWRWLFLTTYFAARTRFILRTLWRQVKIYFNF